MPTAESQAPRGAFADELLARGVAAPVQVAPERALPASAPGNALPAAGEGLPLPPGTRADEFPGEPELLPLSEQVAVPMERLGAVVGRLAMHSDVPGGAPTLAEDSQLPPGARLASTPGAHAAAGEAPARARAPQAEAAWSSTPELRNLAMRANRLGASVLAAAGSLVPPIHAPNPSVVGASTGDPAGLSGAIEGLASASDRSPRQALTAAQVMGAGLQAQSSTSPGSSNPMAAAVGGLAVAAEALHGVAADTLAPIAGAKAPLRGPAARPADSGLLAASGAADSIRVSSAVSSDTNTGAPGNHSRIQGLDNGLAQAQPVSSVAPQHRAAFSAEPAPTAEMPTALRELAAGGAWNRTPTGSASLTGHLDGALARARSGKAGGLGVVADDAIPSNMARGELTALQDAVTARFAAADRDALNAEFVGRSLQPGSSADGPISAPPARQAELASLGRAAVEPAMTEQAKLDLNSAQLPEQMVRRVLQAQAQNQNVLRIALQPLELGHLDIQLKVQGEQLHLTFSAQQAGTRELLEAYLPNLRQLLGETGIQLGDVDVKQHQQSQGKGSDRAGGDGRGYDPSTPTHTAEGQAPRRSSGHDGLIDAFA